MNKNTVSTLIGIIGIILLILAGVFWLNQENLNNSLPDQTNNSPSNNNTEESVTLSSTAKTYTSAKLGIKFTYESKPVETFEVTVTERDNKIFLHGTSETPEQGKMVEVINKNPNYSLKQAIEEQFLRTVKSDDCFVEVIQQAAEDTRPNNYEFAIISYPPPTDTGAPFWQNRDKCHQTYSKTNDVRYFMYNPSVPNKMVFLILGQDSITTDGVVSAPEQRQDWSASVRIIK